MYIYVEHIDTNDAYTSLEPAKFITVKVVFRENDNDDSKRFFRSTSVLVDIDNSIKNIDEIKKVAIEQAKLFLSQAISAD